MSTAFTTTKAYQTSSVMTAGKLPSLILLLEKLRRVIPRLDPQSWKPDGKELIGCQNIVAQLQMSLNFREGISAPELFDVYELLYESLTRGTPASLRVAQYLTGTLLETFRVLPRMAA